MFNDNLRWECDGQIAVRCKGVRGNTPLLLLHGAWESGARFEKSMRYLAAQWYIITPDLRGHGRSRKTPDSQCYTRLAFTTDIQQLLRCQELNKVTVYAATPLAFMLIDTYIQKHLQPDLGRIVLHPDCFAPPPVDVYHLLASLQTDEREQGLFALARTYGEEQTETFLEAYQQASLVPRQVSAALLSLCTPSLDVSSCQSWSVPYSILEPSRSERYLERMIV